MEERVIVSCSHCSEKFRVRREILGRNARCSKCRQVFLLTIPGAIDEDEILSLVGVNNHNNDPEHGPQNGTVAGLRIFDDDPSPEPAPPQVTPITSRRQTANSASVIKLESLDVHGAHLLFPVELLRSDKFRASFPKSCARCSDKRNLHVYLLRWPLSAAGPAGYGARNTPRPVAVLGELPPVDPVELLKYLPVSKNLPEPFCLPFPYYVCHKCKPDALIYPANDITTCGDSCLLTVAGIDIAFEFYSANCGHDTDDYHRLLTHSKLCKVSRWDALPEPQRKRIETWFKPAEREQFVCYVADLDTPPARRGETGIVVTNHRVICGKDPLWRQYSFNEHVIVASQSVPEGTKIDISSVAQPKISFRLADASWTDLRHSLDNLKVGVRILKI